MEPEQYDSKKFSVKVPAPGLLYPQYKTDIIPVTNDLSVNDPYTNSVVESLCMKKEVAVSAATTAASMASGQKDTDPTTAITKDAAFTITTSVNNAYATTTVLPSTDNIMAGVIFNDIYGAELEVDTAASHNVMSTNMFNALVKKSGKKLQF